MSLSLFKRVGFRVVLALVAMCCVAAAQAAQVSTNVITGTIEKVDSGAKTVAVKTADDTKETFVVAGHATVDTGKDVALYSARGAKKGEHVTVYFTEEAGKKIAHVFKHL